MSEMMNKKAKVKKPMFRIIAAAAAIMILAAGLIGLGVRRNNSTVAATVSLDVNPGIEIEVNRNERTLSVTPLNEDAKIVVSNMDLKGSSLEVTINALIGSMLKNGYISEIANSILVSVDGKNTADNSELQDKLSLKINELLQANALNGAVLSQIVSCDDELKALSETYGITLGKAQLIRLLAQADSRYTFESLVSLTINELNLLCEKSHIDIGNVDFMGHASDAAYIGAEAAKQAALTHAGVNLMDVTFIECNLEWDNGRMIYDVEFVAKGMKYDYEIDARTGAVLKFESERYNGSGSDNGRVSDPSLYIGEEEATRIALQHAGVNEADTTHLRVRLKSDDGRMIYDVKFYASVYEYEYEIDALSGQILDYDKEWVGGLPSNPGTTGAPRPGKTSGPNPGTTNVPNPGTTNAPTGYIGIERAKQIALDHAGFSASQVTGLHAEFDYDNGRAVYDVEFHAGGYEYDYEIDARTGAIIHFDKEYEGTGGNATPRPTNAPSITNPPSTYIGIERAKQIALAHAGYTANQVTGLHAEFDYDDGRAVYDVEFHAGGYEYDYEIDARTGAIIHFDKEYEGTGGNATPRPTSSPNPTPKPTDAPSQYIGKERAMQIALAHAGYTANQVSGLHAEFDYEHGRAVYDVEFYAESYDYDYEIDARTGEIIHFEREYDDDHDHGGPNQTQPPAGSNYIGEERAKQIAFNHAGVSASSAHNVEVELEKEHGVMVYKVEFKVGYTEYEYEINATTGAIIDYDIDIDD